MFFLFLVVELELSRENIQTGWYWAQTRPDLTSITTFNSLGWCKWVSRSQVECNGSPWMKKFCFTTVTNHIFIAHKPFSLTYRDTDTWEGMQLPCFRCKLKPWNMPYKCFTVKVFVWEIKGLHRLRNETYPTLLSIHNRPYAVYCKSSLKCCFVYCLYHEQHVSGLVSKTIQNS